MLLSIGHVTVRSANFERTEHFYCDLLGLRAGPRPPISVPGRWFYLGNEAVVHVLPPSDNASLPSVNTIDHFAFNATNMPLYEQKLKAANYPYEARRLADTNNTQLFLVDPDGAKVELCFACDDDSK